MYITEWRGLNPGLPGRSRGDTPTDPPTSCKVTVPEPLLRHSTWHCDSTMSAGKRKSLPASTSLCGRGGPARRPFSPAVAQVACSPDCHLGGPGLIPSTQWCKFQDFSMSYCNISNKSYL